MNIATVLFTYDRSFHTKEVLNALYNNTIQPDKLIISQDGMKETTNLEEWKRVNKIINNVEWCNCEVWVSKCNKGLDRAEVEALDKVFEKYDAAIILEDDCVPHPIFMDFMISCLKKYKGNKKIYSISGYPNIQIDGEEGEDCFFGQRFSTYGWGTWKDRWAQYEQDYRIVNRIKQNKKMNECLNVWGKDLENNLQIGAWDAYWALKVIEKDGFCLAPYKSLIKNIGFDGTGVHCGMKTEQKEVRDHTDKRCLFLPDELVIHENVKKMYSQKFRNFSKERMQYYDSVMKKWIRAKQGRDGIADFFKNKNINHVAIWGCNVYTDLLIDEIKDYVDIEYIILSKNSKKIEFYHGIKVVEASACNGECELIIVIPGWDIENIKGCCDFKRVNMLMGIDALMDACICCE